VELWWLWDTIHYYELAGLRVWWMWRRGRGERCVCPDRLKVWWVQLTRCAWYVRP